MLNTAVCPCCGSVVGASDLPDDVDVADVMVRFSISRAPAVLFLSLWRGRGRIISFETLMDMQDRITHRDDASICGIRGSKKHLLKAVRDCPMRIKATYGMGYRLELTDKNWHWRDAPS